MKPGPGQVLIETRYGGISTGTERLVFNGRVPSNCWESMKCPNQSGEFAFPVSYGYACTGLVVETGPEVKTLATGDLVFALHPHHTHFTISENRATSVPSHIRSDVAVLSANMETALNGIWDAQLQTGDNVLVIGAGVVGLLTAYLASREGITTTISDINPDKREIAEAIGLVFSLVDEIGAGKQEYSAIFNTSASGSGLQTAIDNAGFEARIIEMSWYGDQQVNLTLGGGFHSKRLMIISSQVGSVSPSKRNNCTNSQRLRLAMEKLDDPKLAQLLNPHIAFQELPERMSALLDPASGALCPLIIYK